MNIHSARTIIANAWLMRDQRDSLDRPLANYSYSALRELQIKQIANKIYMHLGLRWVDGGLSGGAYMLRLPGGTAAVHMAPEVAPLITVYTQLPVATQLITMPHTFIKVQLARDLGVQRYGSIYGDVIDLLGTGWCNLYILPFVLMDEDLLTKSKSPTQTPTSPKACEGSEQVSQLAGEWDDEVSFTWA